MWAPVKPHQVFCTALHLYFPFEEWKCVRTQGRVCKHHESTRKESQPARARSLLHPNKAADPSGYSDLMLFRICQTKRIKKETSQTGNKRLETNRLRCSDFYQKLPFKSCCRPNVSATCQSAAFGGPIPWVQKIMWAGKHLQHAEIKQGLGFHSESCSWANCSPKTWFNSDIVILPERKRS